MAWLITKYFLTAGMIVVISEVAKRSDRLGALITALPLVTLATLVWLYLEKQPTDRIAGYAGYTFWYVLPTLPMFILFPLLLPRFGFWVSLMLGIGLIGLGLLLLAALLRRFGIELL
jgi:hypothetical protein